MNDLEKKLMDLPVAEPSESLDERVRQTLRQAETAGRRPRPRMGIPLWAATAAALIFGLLGFFLGRMIHGPNNSEQMSTGAVDVDLVLAVGKLPLDFSVTSDPLPRGQLRPSFSMGEENRDEP